MPAAMSLNQVPGSEALRLNPQRMHMDSAALCYPAVMSGFLRALGGRPLRVPLELRVGRLLCRGLNHAVGGGGGGGGAEGGGGGFFGSFAMCILCLCLCAVRIP